MFRALLPLWIVVLVALLASCDARPSSSPAASASAYGRWFAPSGFAVTDQEGNWACVAKDHRGEPTNIVVGLATVSGDARYPTLPRALFADQLDVPLGSGVNISVPARSSTPLLLVTVAGFAESSPPRPLAELADALWNLEANQGSIRLVVSGNR